jgi:hypothetical protein
MGQFDIGTHVAYDKGSPEINLKGPASLLDKTCLGFSAIAVTGEFGDRPCGVMRTEEDPVNDSVLFLYPGDQDLVKRPHKFQGIIASGYSGLVGDHEDQKPLTVEHPYGLRHSGKNSEPAHMVHVTHLLIDGSIAIDEYRRFFHFPSVSRAAKSHKRSIKQLDNGIQNTKAAGRRESLEATKPEFRLFLV